MRDKVPLQDFALKLQGVFAGYYSMWLLKVAFCQEHINHHRENLGTFWYVQIVQEHLLSLFCHLADHIATVPRYNGTTYRGRVSSN